MVLLPQEVTTPGSEFRGGDCNSEFLIVCYFSAIIIFVARCEGNESEEGDYQEKNRILSFHNYIYNRFIRKISKILNPYIGILLIQLLL